MQCDGAEFAAQGMDVRFEEERAEISLDIARAYPPEAELESYRRTVSLIRGRYVQMRDEYRGIGPANAFFDDRSRPRTDEARIWLGNEAEIRLEGAGSITVEPLNITDGRLRQSWPARLLSPACATDRFNTDTDDQLERESMQFTLKVVDAAGQVKAEASAADELFLVYQSRI